MGMAGHCEAALYIDDTATTDKGHFEVEFGTDYYRDLEKEYDPETEEYTRHICKEIYITTKVAYGLTDNCDITVTTPYKFINDSISGKVNGFSDVTISTKYRLWNENKIFPSFALTFDWKTDSANDDKGLGTGKKDCTINNIFTRGL